MHNPVADKERIAAEIHTALSAEGYTIVAHVPDGGHAGLIRRCEADPAIDAVTLTTEEDGVGLACGAWAGGAKAALLIQSSGVGNIINALALPQVCRVPLLMVVSMRGEWGEFIPWQIPMGAATPAVLEAMGVLVHRVDHVDELRTTIEHGSRFAHNNRGPVAVLLSQRMLGAKQFVTADTDGGRRAASS